MWSRKELKDNAKNVLFTKGKYLKILVVCFVLFIFNGLGNSTSTFRNSNRGFDRNYSYSYENDYSNNLNENIDIEYNSYPQNQNSSSRFISTIFGMFATATMLILFVFVLIRIAIGYPIIVGAKKYLIDAAVDREAGIIETLLNVFKSGNFVNVFLGMFLTDLYTFFWSLLLIIPGIVKGYSYSMISYILAENPEINHNVARRLSMDMTNGHKWDMFVLDLSFILWDIASLLIPIIGSILLLPYTQQTNAQLYLKLREIAIDKNIVNESLLTANNYGLN